ncbi:MAG: hypothetical protein WC196_06210 [Bacilli bacterium]|jgi:hypothetical protein
MKPLYTKKELIKLIDKKFEEEKSIFESLVNCHNTVVEITSIWEYDKKIISSTLKDHEQTINILNTKLKCIMHDFDIVSEQFDILNLLLKRWYS